MTFSRFTIRIPGPGRNPTFAARLLATQDPAAAQAVFERLATDPNLTIREDASRAAAATLPGDFTRLRALLRNTDRLTRVQAAGRILELTR